MTSTDSTYDAFVQTHGLDTARLCQAIVAAGEPSISVRSPQVASENLTRIIQSTLKLANRKGFAAMTLRELASASGLPLGGLYAYIGNNGELAQLIQRRIARTLGYVMAAVQPGGEGADAMLARAIHAHLLTTEALREWFFFLYMEAHHLAADERHQAVAMERASEHVFTEIIQAGQDEDLYRDTDPAVAAGLLKSLLQDWYLKHGKHHERGLTVDTYADILTAAIEAYLTTTPETP